MTLHVKTYRPVDSKIKDDCSFLLYKLFIATVEFVFKKYFKMIYYH